MTAAALHLFWKSSNYSRISFHIRLWTRTRHLIIVLKFSVLLTNVGHEEFVQTVLYQDFDQSVYDLNMSLSNLCLVFAPKSNLRPHQVKTLSSYSNLCPLFVSSSGSNELKNFKTNFRQILEMLAFQFAI